MINKKNIVLVLFSVFALTACEDYLDIENTGSQLATEDEVWQSRSAINSIPLRFYDTMEWMAEIRLDSRGGLKRQEQETGKNYGNIEVFSGDCIFLRPRAVHDLIYKGDYVQAQNQIFANPDINWVWYNSWECVFLANQILDRIDGVTTDIMPQREIDQIKGEAYLFRAFAYHELHKRWGTMPYFKFRIFPGSDLNLPRPTNKELIADIVADLDQAIAILPEVSYLNDAENMGRMGKAAAMALKSRALTIAASPNSTLNNQKDTELWEQAAAAAWDVIQLSQTSDKVGLYEGDYNEIFSTLPGTIEGLWPRFDAKKTPNIYQLTWQWQNVYSGATGLSPSQEVIDRFETADGWPINHPNSNYEEQNPYINRDPRFYKDVLYHGAPWIKRAEGDLIDMRTDPTTGEDRSKPPTFGNSTTGYLARKHIPERFNRIQYPNRTEYTNAPYIRMAEMYLNYAEAVNEAYGNPSATAPGASLTAVEALNTIRNRVGHVNVRPEFTADADAFRDVVRNEFRVELCFEYHSWFDILRWRTAKEEIHQNNKHGVFIIEDASQPTGVRYERFEFEQNRIFQDRHYRYPIRQPDLEIFEIPQLTQNPGW
ncbi:RagB/SusD family nutrient uptake outer membrane protein [Flavivirga amylovorans]|uniref:RagB/SusD family nutrient uptake outer membrane protein n=1 Tax=Flavivirga amylovorans TaxID=870486 RepID=A0ABT8WX86_9FLAO|nr:RagB/SusD family nutrient uptake outer membrane protein [Flavivirga amylovorans]MDO5986232.1 RagB/SusD family nutrient uptake outer membrane protein [Flavivirga amylovorans]